MTGIANAKVIKSMKNVKIDSGCERVLIDPIAPDQNQNMDIRFRVANLHNEIGKKYSYKDEDGKSSKVIHPGWKLIIEGEAQNWTINIKTKDEKINSDVSSPELIFTLLKDKEKIADRHYATGFNIFNSRNAYAVGIKNGKFKFRGGNRQYNEIFEFDLGSAKVKDISFGVEEGGEIEVSDIIIATSDKYSHTDRVEGGVLEKIRKIARGSTDDLIGVWGLWSYSMDDSYVKPGGEYMIGILPEEIEDESAEASGKSSYRIIYLGGAKVGKDCWKEGMVRGRLTPSLFEGIYNVEWLDSKGDKIKKEIKATISDSELKIQIPEYSSNVTFRKI